MKKTRWIITAVAALALAGLLAAPAVAQGMHHRPGPGGHGMLMREALHELDLDPDQRDTIHQLMSDRHDRLADEAESLKAAHTALFDRIHAPSLDETGIRDAAATLASLEADLAVARAELFQEIRRTLTPDQQAQLDQTLQERRSMIERHMGDGMPMGRGPGKHRRHHAGPASTR